MQWRLFLTTLLLAISLTGLADEAWAKKKVGSEFRVNTHNEDVENRSGVADLLDGGFVVTWFAYRGAGFHIYAQRYNSSGQPVGTEFRVNTHSGVGQVAPAVAGLSGGGFIIVWESYDQDGSYDGIYGQRYDDQGNPAGAEFRVNSNTLYDQQNASVAGLENGGFVVVWDSYISSNDTSVYGQRYDAAGVPVGGEFKINRDAQNGGRRNPLIAAQKGGGFVVIWRSSGASKDGIYGQRFDHKGRRLGSKFKISSEHLNGGNQLASLEDGGFIVTWYHNVKGIQALRYDAAGAPVGTPFRVNPDPHFSYVEPSVVGLSDGGFVVTYVSEFNNQPDVVLGRQYDAAGAPLGRPFFVNTFGTHSLHTPRAAGLKNGRFVIIWTWDNLSESRQVRGQLFR